MTYWLSRLWCRLAGHNWVTGHGGWQVCGRIACRGRTKRRVRSGVHGGASHTGHRE